MNDDEFISKELADLGEDDITFVPYYLPYSHWRIKEYFLSIGIELRPYYTWYKAMRYQPCQKYVLHDLYTNVIIGKSCGYTLETLRYYMAKQRVPLHSDSSKENGCNKPIARHERCVLFLQIVDSIEGSSSDDSTEE